MGLAAAAAGKRKATPAASYDEADDDSSYDEQDEGYVERKAKPTKTPGTNTEKKTKSAVEPYAKKAKADGAAATAKGAAATAKGAAATAKGTAAAAKAAAAEAKTVLAKLGVLDRAQVTVILKALVESGKVAPADIDSLMPAPDMGVYVKEGQRLANAISRALPNSRWGSSTDHYGYKRCASANNACKKYIVDHAKVFKTAKQWASALEYANAMLPVARDMVHFDLPDDCKARDAAISTLTALKAEAEGKLGIAPPAAASSQPPAASSSAGLASAAAAPSLIAPSSAAPVPASVVD